VDALAQLSFLVQNALAELAAEHDMSITQARLLGILRDRAPTMNDLGRHLGLDKSSISGLVDRAERRGLVTRTASTVDRRAFHISMTAEGRRLAESVEAEYAQRIEALIATLPATDRRHLQRVANRILAADADRRGTDPGLQ